MTTIDVQAAFVTECQRACKRARDSKKNTDLLKAAALIDSPRMDDLHEWVQQDLLEDYTRTAASVTGWVTP